MKKLSILTLSVSAMMIIVGIGGKATGEVATRIVSHNDTILKAAGDNTNVTVAKVSTAEGGWFGTSGVIYIQLNNITKSNGFGVFSSATVENESIHTYDKYGNEVALRYQTEGYGNGFVINRTKGADYNNSIVYIPNTFRAKMGAPWQGTSDYNGETITVTEDAYYICKLADGAFGEWEQLVNPTSITLDTGDKTVGLGGNFKVTATTEGTTNGSIFYHSSDTNIIEVDSDGNVTTKGTGEATLTANCGTKKVSIKVTVTSEAPSVQTGIKITSGKEMEVYVGEDYNLSKLKAVKVYNDRPKGEEIEITESMISGTFNKNEAGEYTLTLTSDGFTDTFKVTVKAPGTVGIANLQKGYNFGNNSPWGTQFYFQVDTVAGDQYVNVSGTALDDVNNHVKLNGKGGILRALKSFHGQRYEMYFTDEAKNNLKAGDVLTFDKGTPMYFYGGTVDTQTQDPNNDGVFQARNVLDKEYKFVYTGKDYELYVGEPTELNITNSTINVSIGEETQINYNVGPNGTYGTPTYTGYDDKLITVTKDGKVSGVATGTTKITVTLGTIVKEVTVNVLPAKTIKGFKFTNIPNPFSVVKGTENYDLTDKLKTGKFVFEDDTESAETPVGSVKLKTAIDTNTVGISNVEVEVTVDGKTYNATISVEVYEYYDQKPSEVAIVDWFNYAVFFQFPNTCTNAVNMTGNNQTELDALASQVSKISYTRKDGTEVKINGGYQLATNIAIFPEFLYEVKDAEGKVTHAAINENNYNAEGYYQVGDLLKMEKDTPLYKWTGGKGEQDKAVGDGEYIIEGYVTETLVYKYTGSVWTSWIEYTDMEVLTTTLEIEEGKNGTIKAKRIPDNATQGVFSYTSSDESVATVNAYGVVKGIKKGTATITITLKDEDDPSKTKTGTCVVTVKEGEKTPDKPNTEPTDKKGGCGGSIIATSAILSTLALLGVGTTLTISYKKRKEDK